MQVTENRWIDQKFWMSWLACIIPIIFVFSLTIDVAPFLHKDEFMIVDLGRIVLNPETEWSITWLTDNDAPVLLWSYLGPVLQEIAYNTFGQYGPRISALVGAIAASAVMLKYLLVKRTKKDAAFLLSLIFLLDPLFVQGYLLGRVDGWAISFCLSACYFLSNPGQPEASIKLRSFIAGSLSIIAFFIWPSAIILFPLIAYELFLLYRRDRRFGISVFPFILGCCLFTIIILLPIASRIYSEYSEVLNGLIVNLRYGSGSTESSIGDYFSSAVELMRVLKFTVVLVLVAFLSLIIKKQVSLLAATFVASCIIIFTLVYIHRVIYLIPYLILLAGGLYINTASERRRSMLFRIVTSRLHLVLLLIWSAGLSLFVRSALAFDNKNERERTLVFNAAKTMIGHGDFSVMSTNEFYYPGRSLGWKMYSPYLAVGQPVSFVEMMKILPHVDYVILQTRDINDQLEKALRLQGFHLTRDYNMYHAPQKEEVGIQTNVKRIRNIYSIFPKPYGPYKLYVRRELTYPLTYINKY